MIIKNYFNEFINTAFLNLDNNAVIYPIFSGNGKIKEVIYSYRDIINHVFSIGLILAKLNSQNKPIGIFLPNHPLFTSAFLSILSKNFIAVPIDPKLTRVIICKILSDNKIKIIITNRVCSKTLEDMNFKKIKLLVMDDLIKKIDNQILLKSDFLNNKKNNDTIIVSYTSGTSGIPKGVLVTNKNVYFVCKKYCQLYHLNNQSKTLIALPIWHNYGMFAGLLSTILAGGTTIIMKDWLATCAVKAICKYATSVFPGSPFMYADIVNEKNCTPNDFHSLKVCDSGGYYLPIDCIKKFEKKTGAIITEGYGLTETTSLTHFNFSAKYRKIGSIGRKIPEVFCRIIDENEMVTKPGKYGLLWVKGPMVCKGYVNMKSSNFKNGWFNTEDIAKIDSNGNYFIAGRLSDTKNIKGNSKYFPRDIEEIIYTFKGLIRVYVKSNDDDSYRIYVIMKNNKLNNKLKRFLKNKFSKIYFEKILFVKKIPMTSTGKIKSNTI